MDLVFLSLLVLLVAATLWIWQRDRTRARRARIDPDVSSPKKTVGARELAESLLAYCRESPLLRTDVEHGNLLVTWNLEPAPADAAGTLPAEAHSIELRFHEPGRTVHARHGRGVVEWWPRKDDASTLEPNVEWTWDMEPDFVRPLPPDAHVPAPEEAPHSAEALVEPIRRRVLRAGWTWQPVLELPVTESVDEGIESTR